MPWSLGVPLNCPELTILPASTQASLSGCPSQSGGEMTTLMGSPYFPAKAKSRVSWAGTAMTAPVP